MTRTGSNKRLKILVADSNAGRALRLSEKIKDQLGAEVLTVGDSLTAVDLLSCGGFDAVTIAHALGESSGADFIIEASRIARGTALVMVRSGEEKDVAAEAIGAGAVDFVEADGDGLDRVGETILEAIEKAGSGASDLEIEDVSKWERIYRSTFDVAPNALAIIDEDGTILAVNAAAEKLIAGDSKSAIGLNLFDLLSGWDVDMFRRYSFEDEFPVEFSAELQTSKGEAASVSVVVNELGGTEGTLVVSLVDLRRPALYRNMWRYLMKDAQDMVALLDEEGRILSTSKGMVAFTGILESEQVGSLITTIEHPANRERMKDVFETARGSGYVTMENFEYKLWDGQVRYCSGSFYKLVGGNYLIIAHDVTERRKREMDLEVYGGMVAHELRTPLTAINGYVDFMIRQGGLSKEVLDNLKKIRLSTERIDRTAQALLDISRVSHLKQPLTLVDVQEVAEEVIDSLASIAAEESARIVIPEKLPDVRYAEEDLRLIISNLLTNALKYGRGEEGLPVIISWKKYPGRFIFSFKDFGPGIPDSIKDKVVAPFFKTEDSDGLGLGLALVRRVVESHGGDCWFESWENEGSTFYFSIVE